MVMYDSEPVKAAMRELGRAMVRMGEAPCSAQARHVAMQAYRLKGRTMRDGAGWEAYNLLVTHWNDVVLAYQREGR
jgi:hypothetical protein